MTPFSSCTLASSAISAWTGVPRSSASLGHTGQGALLPFEALVAIHLMHRFFAVIAAIVLLGLAVSLRRHLAWRGWALWLTGPRS